MSVYSEYWTPKYRIAKSCTAGFTESSTGFSTRDATRPRHNAAASSVLDVCGVQRRDYRTENGKLMVRESS